MKFSVGDHVRYHTVAEGWRFGRVIGTHWDRHVGSTINHFGSPAPSVEMATVRLPEGDEAIAQFRLEACDPPRLAVAVACHNGHIIFERDEGLQREYAAEFRRTHLTNRYEINGGYIEVFSSKSPTGRGGAALLRLLGWVHPY